MQNEQVSVVSGPHRTNEAAGVIGMDDMMIMSFDQLWDHSQSRTGNGEASVGVQHRPPRLFPEAVIEFGAVNALQGVARSVPFGFGSFDLDPYNLGRVQRGVKPEVLQRLSSGSKSLLTEEESVCYICMDPFESETQTKELPCKHVFCRGCISEWLKENDTCPVCRYKFPEHDTYLNNLNR